MEIVDYKIKGEKNVHSVEKCVVCETQAAEISQKMAYCGFEVNILHILT